jgi:NADP-dependent 3-hydroxy acid dehydrogenase YdfG
MEQELKGRVAIVTGASSGIGEATALALARKGMKVAAVARRRSRLEDLAQRLDGAGGELFPLGADVSDEAAVRRVVNETERRWGRVDVLVANAGVMLLGPILNANTDEWRRMVNVNLLGLLYSVHAVLPIMARQERGDIITISSVAGRVSRTGNGVYSATKFAVRAFSESLRQEAAKSNIRVTTIEPGAVDTELPQHITHPEARAWADQFYGSMKTLRSEDIANAVVYVLEQPPYVDVNEILIRPTEQQR